MHNAHVIATAVHYLRTYPIGNPPPIPEIIMMLGIYETATLEERVTIQNLVTAGGLN
jgi:hypothetical protein